MPRPIPHVTAADPVMVTALAMLTVVGSESTTVDPAPLSVSVIWFAVPVRTRSLVSVGLVASVTYWASGGAVVVGVAQVATPAAESVVMKSPAPQGVVPAKLPSTFEPLKNASVVAVGAADVMAPVLSTENTVAPPTRHRSISEP